MDIYDYLSLKQIRKDCKSIIDLIKFMHGKEYSAIVCLNILPIFSLIIYEANRYIKKLMPEVEIEREKDTFSLKDIRMKNKLFYDKFNRNIQIIRNIDYIQDRQFKELDGDKYYYNIGIYLGNNLNIIGNTHLASFFNQEENMKKKKEEEIKELYDKGDILLEEKLSKYVYNYGEYLGSLSMLFYNSLSSINIKSNYTYKDLDYEILYKDLNTNKDIKIFSNTQEEKVVKLYLLYLISIINAVLYLIRPIIHENFCFLYKIEFIICYYSIKSLEELYKYLKEKEKINNESYNYIKQMKLDDRSIFNVNVRNCMMHYGMKDEKTGEKLILDDKFNLEIPFYGLIESQYGICHKDSEKIINKRQLKCKKVSGQFKKRAKGEIKIQ